jgi:hypothetical protein
MPVRPARPGRRPIAIGAALLIAAGALAACEVKVVDVPDEIASDCSGNVSAQLNQWLADLPNGTSVQLHGGCYRIDQTLVLADRHDVDIDGGNARFETQDPTGDGSTFDDPSTAARTRSHLRIVRGANIKLHDLTIDGPNTAAGTGIDAYVPALEAQHGIDVQGTQNIELYDLGITDVFGDFVSFTLSGSTWSSGTLHDSVLARNGRQGVSLTGAHHVMIEHNDISETRRATFDLEPNGGDYGVEFVTIRDNTIGPGRLLFVAAGGTGPVNDIGIADNQLAGRDMVVFVDGAGADRRHHWWISGNRSDTPWGSPAPASAITLHDVDDAAVVDNRQPLQAGRGDAGVDITGSTGVTVQGNSFTNAWSVLELPDPNAVVCGNQVVAGDPYDQPAPCAASAAAGAATAAATVPPSATTTRTTTRTSTTTSSTGTSTSTTAPRSLGAAPGSTAALR